VKVYLGGPINGCTDDEAHGWREQVKAALSSAGHTWRDPMDRDYRGREMEPGIAAEIVDGDRADISECDVLLMNAPRPSWGTAMEILLGHTIGRPVYVVLPDDGSQPSPWLTHHATVLRGSVVEAVNEVLRALPVRFRPSGEAGDAHA
jgi:nucleoside 2-deoxyribosyltransferase